MKILLSNFILLSTILTSLYIYSFKESYNILTKEEPLAILSFTKIENQKYLANVYIKEKKKLPFLLFGDQWRIDVKYKKFKYFQNLLGIKNKYLLDRIEGRYKKIKDQNTKINKSYDLNYLNNENDILKFNLINSMLIDTTYGSSIYKEIKENTIYKIYKTNTGLIVHSKYISKKQKSFQNQLLEEIKNFF